jgi:hypothetical protein
MSARSAAFVPMSQPGYAGAFFVWLVFAASAANSGFYSILSSGGLVQADSWYFLDTFVRSYLDGNLSWRAFFVNRGGSDHVQVLPKLVMLFHLHYFDLDFKVEGLIGWMFAAIGAATLIGIHFKTVPADRRGTAFFMATAASVAVYLSLNSTNIYTWSLVTLGFAGVWFFMLCCVAAWVTFSSGRGVLALLAASSLLCLTSDKFAILALLSLTAALLIQVDDRGGARRLVLALVSMATPVLVMLLFVHLPGIRPASSEPPVQLARLFDIFLSGLHPWREVILIPLSSGLIHGWQLEPLPPWRVHVETGLGLLLAATHAVFWWTIAFNRRRAGLAGVVSCSLMLLSYGATAGIIFTRIAEFGPEYVRQPRYVTLDALAIIACLIWFSSIAGLKRVAAAGRPPQNAGHRTLWGHVVVLLAIIALAIQIPMSLRSWDLVKYVSQYQQAAALQMGQLLSDPSKVPAGCLDILTVCEMSPAKRADLMTLLSKNGLNLFSPRFQQLWRLYPYPAPAR